MDRPHAYTSQLNPIMGQYAFVEKTARKTLEALGQPALPPFDEDDEYARDVPVDQLGDALLRHDRYDNGAVLERMTKAKDRALRRPTRRVPGGALPVQQVRGGEPRHER